MSRSTFNSFNQQVLGPGADGNAVVPGSDSSVRDHNIAGELDVDAIGIWTVTVGNDFGSLDLHILAAIYGNVEHLAI